MGWRKKGTRHTYDSNLGHAYFIGVHCSKVVRMLVYYKKWTRYDVALAMGETPIDHEDYPRKYKTGSSKAMEDSATLNMILELYILGVRVEYICSDDDSTMRAHLHHIGTVPKAKLPIDIPEPEFLYNASHCIKVMLKDIFGLALISKAKSECEKIDALRLKNISWGSREN